MTSMVHYKSPITSTGIGSPKDAKFGQAQKIEKQQAQLLSVSSYHVPCITNHAINPLIPVNQKVIVDALRLAWLLSEMLKRFEQNFLREFRYHLSHDYLSGHVVLSPKILRQLMTGRLKRQLWLGSSRTTL